MRDLIRFFAYTYGAELPDDDAGRDDAFILAHHVARLNGDPARNVANYARQWCPWIGDDVAALMHRVQSKPIKWTADSLGKRLGLLDEVRTKLGITTIRPIDATPEQLERRRRERANAKRRKQTRADYEATSISKAKPWEAEGVSRRTWYRRRGTGPRQQSSSMPTRTCATPQQAAPPMVCSEGPLSPPVLCLTAHASLISVVSWVRAAPAAVGVT